VETSNRQLKSILNKTVEKGGKDWSKKLDGALWAYRTAHKTPIGMTPYQFVYGKSCHLSLELEHKAYWVINEMNLDVAAARIKWRIQISELKEMRLKAYESATIYKERMSDGMIKDSNQRNSRKATRSSSLTQSSRYSGKAN
jgi:hypothetical protein